ncbi:MAG TPA: hypothetical protein VF588_05960 [Pyrinomonadaceae bacterium]
MENSGVVFVEAGRVEVQSHPMPAPAAGEVLVRTTRSLISIGTELMLLGGAARRDSVWARLRSFRSDPATPTSAKSSRPARASGRNGSVGVSGRTRLTPRT